MPTPDREVYIYSLSTTSLAPYSLASEARELGRLVERLGEASVYICSTKGKTSSFCGKHTLLHTQPQTAHHKQKPLQVYTASVRMV